MHIFLFLFDEVYISTLYFIDFVTIQCTDRAMPIGYTMSMPMAMLRVTAACHVGHSDLINYVNERGSKG